MAGALDDPDGPRALRPLDELRGTAPVQPATWPPPTGTNMTVEWAADEARFCGRICGQGHLGRRWNA